LFFSFNDLLFVIKSLRRSLCHFDASLMHIQAEYFSDGSLKDTLENVDNKNIADF